MIDDKELSPDVSVDDQQTDASSPETTPTDFVEFEGVKVPREAFEKQAKDLYRDQFDAYDNREKWQAENTKKAQEIAELRRDADSYRRLQSQPQSPPTNAYEASKQKYMQNMSKRFPDVDPQKG